jgi:hypothetical protein
MNLITQLRTKSHARHLDHGADIMGMRSYRFEQLSWSIRQGSFFLHESMEEGKWVRTDISRVYSKRIQASLSPLPFVSTTASVFIA